MPIVRLPRIFAGAWLLAVALPANAQDIGGVFDMGGLTGTASMDPVIEQSREMAIRQGEGDPLPGRPYAGSLMRSLSQALTLQAGGRAPGSAQGFTANRAGSVQTADMRYSPSMELRRKNLASFVEKTRAADPEGAKKLEQLFATDIIGQIDGILNRFDMSVDNVADAYALWWISAWQASRGITDEPTRAEMAAVKAQVEQAMSNTSAFASATDATKQELAEACLIQAALIDGYMVNASGDEKQLGLIADAVRKGARKMGLDLNKMRLTDTGFVPSALGAADKPGSDEDAEKQLAAVAGANEAERASDAGPFFAYTTIGLGTAAGIGWLALRRGRS
jgi:pyruvate/2-oxoglutarate dehydrogenase complex dihydrolipoamide acyltransferase (E2) component